MVGEVIKLKSEIRNKIGEYFVEGVRSIAGKPRTTIGKGAAEGLFAILIGVAFIVGVVILVRNLGW